jgi:hypothetical protein
MRAIGATDAASAGTVTWSRTKRQTQTQAQTEATHVLCPMCQQAAATLAEAGTAPEAVQINRHVDRCEPLSTLNVY